MKNLILLCILFLGSFRTYSQEDTLISLYMVNDSVLVGIFPDGSGVRPVFADTNINNIIAKYAFKRFEKGSNSRFPDVNQIYAVVSNNIAVGQELEDHFPDIFWLAGIGFPAVLLGTDDLFPQKETENQLSAWHSGKTLHITVADGATVSVQIMDVTGRIVEQSTFSKAANTVVNTATYLPGLYCYVLQSPSGRVKGKFYMGSY